MLDEESKQKHMGNLDHLQNDALKNVIHCRLVDHITSCDGLSLADYHWQFMIQNIKQISVIIKMAGMIVDDCMLRTIEWHHTLFSLNYHNSYEETKLEYSKEHGCYIIYDTKRGKFARAGSASSKICYVNATPGCTGRINGHANESKKNQEKSYFYNFYPDKNSMHSNKALRRGDFQDLNFVSYLRFKDKLKSKTQDLFH